MQGKHFGSCKSLGKKKRVEAKIISVTSNGKNVDFFKNYISAFPYNSP